MLLRLAIIIIFCYFCFNELIAQTLDITRGGLGARLRSQPIVLNEGRIENEKLLNLRTNSFTKDNSSISSNGKVLLLENELIKDENAVFRKVSLPFADDNTISRRYLSANGNTVAIPKRIDTTIEYEIHFFNVDIEGIDRIIKIPSGNGFFFNSDASIFTYHFINDSRLIFNVVERSESDFTTSTAIIFPENSELIGPLLRYISSSGDRIFFSAKIGLLASRKSMFILDRINNGWSEPREWQVLDVDGNPLRLDFIDIANNGRTALVGLSDSNYAITHEIDGVWSEPEPIGYIQQFFDTAQISENGKVIAIQSFKREIQSTGARLYDAILMLQNPAGKWIQRQVNDPQLEVFDGIMLSDDGTQLFWLPANTSSVPGAEEYR